LDIKEEITVMDKIIFIAAPYINPDPVANANRVVKVADELIKLGFTPFIPHLAMLWHAISPKPVDFWYEYDLKILKKCDALLRLPGESKGANREVEMAIKWNIPVYFNIGDLVDDSVDERKSL